MLFRSTLTLFVLVFLLGCPSNTNPPTEDDDDATTDDDDVTSDDDDATTDDDDATADDDDDDATLGQACNAAEPQGEVVWDTAGAPAGLVGLVGEAPAAALEWALAAAANPATASALQTAFEGLDDSGCPTETSSASTTPYCQEWGGSQSDASVTWTGGCTAAGLEWSGSLTRSQTEQNCPNLELGSTGSGSDVLSSVGFEAAWDGSGDQPATWRRAISGSWSWSSTSNSAESSSGTTATTNLQGILDVCGEPLADVTVARTGRTIASLLRNTGASVTWEDSSNTVAVSGSVIAYATDAPWEAAYAVNRSWGMGPLGEFGCEAEPGTGSVVAVSGFAGPAEVAPLWVVTITYDGGTLCDGCGVVALDGVPAGSWCGD